MKNKRILLTVLAVILASCGGGGGVDTLNNALQSSVVFPSGLLLMPALY